MKPYDIMVIGAGAGGLVIAIGGARAGKRVLLIERGHWGGDCTNFGCVPSKTLIESSKRTPYPEDGGEAIFRHVREIVQQVRTHEEPKALAEIGVETVTGNAQFIDAHHVEVNGAAYTAKNCVIATGSSPLIPPIEGLEGAPFLTNETIFDLERAPKRLAIIGGGPIGCELAQAFARLGSEVIHIHRGAHLLKKEELCAQEVIEKQFEKEGVELLLNHTPQRVNYEEACFRITLKNGGETHLVNSDALLISVGRQPNLQALALEKASVNFTSKGIIVDKFGRTSNKSIWAVGDVTGGPQFTHAAENQARAVLTSLLLPFKKKLSRQAVPRATYTDPEVASFGPLEHEAKALYGEENLKTYHIPFTENDRAITADQTEGFVKVITKKMSSKIVGATIVGPRAGEMLPELSLAAKEKIPLKKLADLIHPYPTYNLAIRKAGDQWLTQVFLPWLQKPSQWLPWKRLLPLGILILLMIIAYTTGVHRYFTFQMLQERHGEIKGFVEAHPVITPILYTVLYTISTSLSLPGGALLSLLGGFLFPIPWSTLYVLIGATLGASVIFLAARTAVGDFLRKKAGPFLKKMERGFQKNAWSYLLFLRFVPLFPFWLVNIAPAVFNVSFHTFVWTTFVGIIPGAYVYTQTGAGLGAIFETGGEITIGALFNIQLRIALIALGLFSLIPIFVKKILAKRAAKRKHSS